MILRQIIELKFIKMCVLWNEVQPKSYYPAFKKSYFLSYWSSCNPSELSWDLTAGPNPKVWLTIINKHNHNSTHHPALTLEAAHNDQWTQTLRSGASHRWTETSCEKALPCSKGNLCSHISWKTKLKWVARSLMCSISDLHRAHLRVSGQVASLLKR